MECVMALADNLRETNRRLGFWLHSIATKNKQTSVVTPEIMAGLLSELLGAGVGLRAHALPAPGQDRELDSELEEYRRQVERLRDLLPVIQKQLLAERARIEGQRSRIQSVAQWVRASRQTL
jgi:hypothetical protein